MSEFDDQTELNTGSTHEESKHLLVKWHRLWAKASSDRDQLIEENKRLRDAIKLLGDSVVEYYPSDLQIWADKILGSPDETRPHD